jgi:hypothetical protein
MRKLLFVLLFSFLLSSIQAQSVSLDITPSSVVYNYFYPAYLDPSDPGSQPFLFLLTAENTGFENIADYEVHFSFFWRDHELINDAVIFPESGTIYEIIEAGEIFQLNNRDIVISGNTGNFNNVEGLEFDDILDASDEFKDLVLNLGYFPDGDYLFEIKILDESGLQISNTATFTFTIITPTAISLISPGNPFGLEPANLSDPYPYFLWFSNLSEFSFDLYEVDEMVDDPQEIPLQSDPVFSTVISGATVFSYPTGAYPLHYNTLYAWQVRAVVSSPITGEEGFLESGFFIFKILQETIGNQSDQSIKNFLEQLNIEELDELLQLFDAGYSFDVMYLNGAEVTVDYLNEILLKLQSGELQISSVRVE